MEHSAKIKKKKCFSTVSHILRDLFNETNYSKLLSLTT